MDGDILVIKIVFRIDQPTCGIRFLAVAESDQADLTNARHIGVGRFDIDSDEISHSFRSSCRVQRGTPNSCRRRSGARRSEEHPSELQSLMRISYAVFCLQNKNTQQHKYIEINY